MQRAKAVQVFDQDLKEAISSVKRNGYRKALGAARDRASLALIEHEVRADFQLTRDDRLQLLADVEGASALAG